MKKVLVFAVVATLASTGLVTARIQDGGVCIDPDIDYTILCEPEDDEE